jgi:hypothetical protein
MPSSSRFWFLLWDIPWRPSILSPGIGYCLH